MAERLILHHHPGDTILHRWDGRGKLLAIVMTSALILQDRLPVMIGLSALLPLGWWLGRIPAARLLREVRTGLWFFLMIVLVYAIFAPKAGDPAIPWVPFTTSGLQQGLWVCWRLFLLLAYAALFSAVTSPRELRCAVLWFLAPLRFLPRQRIAFMAGLTIRFVPLVMDELDAIRDAHKARLGELRRNPLRRARYMILPLFRRVLQRSDDLALALATRGYREDLPVEAPRLPISHLIPAVLLVVVWISGLTRYRYG
jgi:biotin transport system permease protein